MAVPTNFDDVLATAAGADTVLALLGNDVLLLAAPADHAAGEKLDGGAGYDSLWIVGTAPAAYTLNATVVAIEAVRIADGGGGITGTAAIDVDASALTPIASGFTLAGNAAGNVLTGTRGSDIIVGNGGADTVAAGLGSDRVVMSVVAGEEDAVNAGALTESNTLALAGVAAAVVVANLTLADQYNDAGGLVQSGFANLDASLLEGFGVQVTASLPRNMLVGSPQDDVFVYVASGHAAGDVIIGGAGNDVIRFDAPTGGTTLTLQAGHAVESAAVATGALTLSINASAIKGGITLVGNDGINTLTGGAGDDFLDGNLGADLLSGGAGNDRYVVDASTDIGPGDKLEDSAGKDDRIVFTSTVAGDTLTLVSGIKGVEAVWLTGLEFDVEATDLIHANGAALAAGMSYVGNAAANQLTGGAGNDTFTGNGGNDVIVGGAGADKVVMQVEAGGVDQVDAGNISENNTLKLVGTAAAAVVVNLGTAADADQLAGLAGTQSDFTHVDASELLGEALQVTGGAEANTLVGSAKDDIFTVLAQTHLARDRIVGGSGDDILRFAATVAGQTLTLTRSHTELEILEIADETGNAGGTLALNINASASAVTGGDGGSANGFELRGNDGANQLTGSIGGDTLIGNLGADVLAGGAGDDLYVYRTAAEGAGDRITDASGSDTVQFKSAVAGEILVVASAAGIEAYGFDPDGTVAAGIDLSALRSSARVDGNDADNMITGTSAIDTLVGGKGADTLIGGAGNDFLEGGEARDSIVGGAGADAILMDTVEPDDIDAGLLTENNRLLLKGATGAFVDLSVPAGADQVLSAPGVQRGFSLVDGSRLEETARLVVIGRAGNDSMIGGAGADVFRPGLGADTVEGGKGADAFVVSGMGELGTDLYRDSGGDSNDWLHFDSTGNGITFTAKDSNLAGVDVLAAGYFGEASFSANLNIDVSKMRQPVGLAGNAGNNILTGNASGQTFFDYGGVDLMRGEEGGDEYLILEQWENGDRIHDTGKNGVDQLYYAAFTSHVLVATTASVSGVERFVVSSSAINIDGPAGYIRDVRSLNNAGIDASGLTYSIHLAGSYGDNFLRGTSAPDTIVGFFGNDTIRGGGGTDVITMDVGPGNVDDIDTGGQGETWTLVGAPIGVVTIDLAAADQLVSIGIGPDSVLLQTGFLHVDAASLTTPEGADPDDNYGVVVYGTPLANRLIGTNEDDVLSSRGGADTLIGAAGNDAFGVVANGTEVVDGGDGNDTLRFVSTNDGETLAPAFSRLKSIEAVAISDALGDTSGLFQLNVNVASFTIAMKLAGNDGPNAITATRFEDTVTGNGGADTLNGGLGDDLYLVEDGAHVVPLDRISDTGGTDTLRFVSLIDGDSVVLTALMSGLDVLAMHDGPEDLVGTLSLNASAAALPGGIAISGNKFANLIIGSAFADSVSGGDGYDDLRTGGGADTIGMALDADNIDDVDGGATAEGNLLVVTGEAEGDMMWDLSSVVDQLVSINGTDEGRIVRAITHLDASAASGGAVTVVGTAEGNSLVGTALDDVFITQSVFVAGDAIAGGEGSDALRFTSTDDGDTLVLGAGFTGLEVVQLSDAAGDTSGATALHVDAVAVAGALAITGNNGDNLLQGTAFADTIVGNGGADTVLGGAGADWITMQVAAGDIDAISAGAVAEGNVLLLAGAAAAAFSVDLSLAVGDQVGNGAEALVQSGFSGIDASAMSGFGITVTGSSGNNRIIGSAQADAIVAGTGADTVGIDVGGAADAVDAGAAAEGNLILLSGAAGAAVGLDLSVLAGDQLSTMAGVQGGFMHVDASALTGAGIELAGSAAGNHIVGSAQADTLLAGLGADTITWDASTPADRIDAGDLADGDILLLAGTAPGAPGVVDIDLAVAPDADQLLSVNGANDATVQSDFQHVNASALAGAGLNVRGNALNNHFFGTAQQDEFTGGAGSDRFWLGGGEEGDGVRDVVVYERPSDGVTGIALPHSYDVIREFDLDIDEIAFAAAFNGGAFDLNDILRDDGTADNLFKWSTDAKADFAKTHEALLVTAAKSALKTEAQLTAAGLPAVLGAIARAGGVQAGTGDDGLIVVQTPTLAGLYYYQELDGRPNAVAASELTLLGIVHARLDADDVSFI